MSKLDDIQAMQKTDPDHMLDRINELPDQFVEAWRNVQGFKLPANYSQVTSIVVLGMGGSAIGGDLTRTLIGNEIKVPMLVSREYDVPAFVGPDTLVIGSSYSGGTEETLSAFEQARGRGAKLLAITTGGRIKDIADQAGAPVLQFSYKAQPRAALGHSVVPLIGVLQNLGLVGDKGKDVEEAIQIMVAMRGELAAAIPAHSNPAKQLAELFEGRLPVIYGEGLLSEVARRWKGQINENSKAWSFFETLPELNHNAIVGYEYPADLAKKAVIVFLTSKAAHPRVKLRIKATEDILTNRGIAWREIPTRGESRLAQMMASIYLGDFTSYYLAMLYGTDPSPVDVIAFLKNRLAQAK